MALFGRICSSLVTTYCYRINIDVFDDGFHNLRNIGGWVTKENHDNLDAYSRFLGESPTGYFELWSKDATHYTVKPAVPNINSGYLLETAEHWKRLLWITATSRKKNYKRDATTIKQNREEWEEVMRHISWRYTITPTEIMRNVYITKVSWWWGDSSLPVASDSVRVRVLVTDFTLIKIQPNDTFMQMFFELFPAHRSNKVS